MLQLYFVAIFWEQLSHKGCIWLKYNNVAVKG